MRTRLSQFLEAVTVTAPSAIKELASKLAVYADDAAYESALGAGAEGDIYFNSTIQMIRLYKNAAWENFAADEIDYDNTTSGLSAATVQAAIDEVESILSAHIAATSAHGIAGGVVMGTEGSTLDTVNFGIADDASTGTDLNIIPTKIMTRMTSVASGDTLAGITNTNTNFLTLINDSTFPLSILNDSTGEATAAYRILTGTGSNLSLAAGSSLLLKYDTTESRWRVIGGSGAGISDPMTTRGDLIYRNPSNTTARLATGLFGQLLGTDGTDTWWENPKEFNYIGNPDALHNATDYVTTSTAGTLTVAQTTTASECPEDPLKATAWRISGSGLTAGDYIEFQAAKVIANSHGGRMGRGVLHVRDVTSGQLIARAYNKTTSTYIGQSVALDTDRDYLFDLPLTAGDNIVIHVIAVGTSITAMSVSGVGIFFEAASTGSSGVWKQYDENTVTFSSTPTGWSVTRAVFVPYKTYGGSWRMQFNIRAAITAGSTPSVVVDGVTFKNGVSQALAVATGAATTNANAIAVSNTGQISITKDAASTEFRVSGDVELESQPTWVDYDGTILTATEAIYQNAALSVTSNNGQVVADGSPILYEDVIEAQAITYNPATGVATVLADGDYIVSASAAPTAGTMRIMLQVNGSDVRRSGSGATASIIELTYLLKNLNTGDQIRILNNRGSSATLNTNTTDNTLCVFRKADRSGSTAGFPTSDKADTTKQYLVKDVRKFSKAADGSFTSGTVYGYRDGDLVTVIAANLGHASSATVASSAGFIPEGFRPAGSTAFNCYLYDETHGLNIQIATTGDMTTFYRNEAGTVNRTSTLQAFVTYRTEDA